MNKYKIAKIMSIIIILIFVVFISFCGYSTYKYLSDNKEYSIYYKVYYEGNPENNVYTSHHNQFVIICEPSNKRIMVGDKVILDTNLPIEIDSIKCVK